MDIRILVTLNFNFSYFTLPKTAFTFTKTSVTLTKDLEKCKTHFLKFYNFWSSQVSKNSNRLSNGVTSHVFLGIKVYVAFVSY